MLILSIHIFLYSDNFQDSRLAIFGVVSIDISIQDLKEKLCLAFSKVLAIYLGSGREGVPHHISNQNNSFQARSVSFLYMSNSFQSLEKYGVILSSLLLGSMTVYSQNLHLCSQKGICTYSHNSCVPFQHFLAKSCFSSSLIL